MTFSVAHNNFSKATHSELRTLLDIVENNACRRNWDWLIDWVNDHPLTVDWGAADVVRMFNDELEWQSWC